MVAALVDWLDDAADLLILGFCLSAMQLMACCIRPCLECRSVISKSVAFNIDQKRRMTMSATPPSVKYLAVGL